MNKQYISKIFLLIAFVSALSSCNDFLNVRPAGQLDEAEQFSDIQGFRDAMYGVYGDMASAKLYGGAMSYQVVDQLGQMFGYDNVENATYQIGQYQYEHQKVEPSIEAIWNNQYQAISYINNILKHIDKAPFKNSELALMRGECLGLRAFLHFDLARLYTQDYQRSNDKTRGLPYSVDFNLQNRTLYSLHDTYKWILKDLDEAEKLLQEDSVIEASTTPKQDYRADRAAMFNKYAVYATKARVYYAMGKYNEAANYAEKVIKSKNNFYLKKLTSMEQVKRFPAKGELIFGLYNNQLSSNIAKEFLAQPAAGNFMEGRRDIEKLYETENFTATSSDIRYSSYYKINKGSGATTSTFIRFLEDESQIKTNPVCGFTLIRLPEMYYILSESVYDKDKNKAIALLNEVRNSRGLDSVNGKKVDTREHFEQEMLRERMREMPGEGQIFYALKHYNRAFTDFRGTKTFQASPEIFILPWPKRELEFGNK